MYTYNHNFSYGTSQQQLLQLLTLGSMSFIGVTKIYFAQIRLVFFIKI